MPMNKLNDIMTFVEIVDSGSFTAAALNMGLPKSNISRKLTRLETELGVRLLERSTRRQRLTEVGQVFYSHGKRIKEELALAQSSVESLIEVPRGKIRLSTTVTIGQQILRPHLADFLQAYPLIDIELCLSNRRVDLLEEGYDLVIRVGELEESNLVAKYLGTTERRLYASEKFVKHYGLPHTPEQLTRLPCLLMSAADLGHKWQLKQERQQVELILNPRLIADDFVCLRQAVIDHIGIAALPHYMCTDPFEGSQLVEVLPDWHLSQTNIYAVYPSHRGATPKLRVFLDYFAQVFKKRLEQNRLTC